MERHEWPAEKPEPWHRQEEEENEDGRKKKNKDTPVTISTKIGIAVFYTTFYQGRTGTMNLTVHGAVNEITQNLEDQASTAVIDASLAIMDRRVGDFWTNAYYDSHFLVKVFPCTPNILGVRIPRRRPPANACQNHCA